MRQKIQFLRSCALLVLLAVSTMAAADSWAPATVETTMSANGRYRVIVTPRPLGGALPYFRDKVAGVEPAGQRAGSPQNVPMARVERRWKRGAWQLVWEGPLVNDVAPVSVLLSDDGARLVTFDNWHSVGFGEDVVVIYDARGGLVRKLSLEDILPPYYIPHLPRSVSSRSWGGSHRLVDDDRLVELVVARPGVRRDREYSVPVRIQLSDGTLLPGTGEAWERAVAEAKALEAERVAAWQAVRLGDAAACPSLIAGEGAGFALAEAYVLAGELNRHGNDTAAALARYQARLQAVVARKQKHAESLVASFVPRTGLGVRARDYATLMMRLPVFPKLLMGRYFRDEMALPDYCI